jgi:hypothetical protein
MQIRAVVFIESEIISSKAKYGNDLVIGFLFERENFEEMLIEGNAVLVFIFLIRILLQISCPRTSQLFVNPTDTNG